jgi:predicted nucleic acid-binding protein
MTHLACHVVAAQLDVTQESAAAMPIKATSAQVQFKRRFGRKPKLIALGFLFVPLCACQTLGQEDGFLPDTIRSASAVLKPGDYPDLTKIPDAPTDLPSQKAWANLQSGLQADATRLEANPNSKPMPAGEVLAWFHQHEQHLYVSSITIGEIRKGLELMSPGKRKASLQLWFQSVCERLEGQILSFNTSTAHVWGQLVGRLEQKGILIPTLDSQIAATAQRHGLTVVTRNVDDFKPTGVKVLNPFRS